MGFDCGEKNGGIVYVDMEGGGHCSSIWRDGPAGSTSYRPEKALVSTRRDKCRMQDTDQFGSFGFAPVVLCCVGCR